MRRPYLRRTRRWTHAHTHTHIYIMWAHAAKKTSRERCARQSRACPTCSASWRPTPADRRRTWSRHSAGLVHLEEADRHTMRAACRQSQLRKEGHDGACTRCAPLPHCHLRHEGPFEINQHLHQGPAHPLPLNGWGNTNVALARDAKRTRATRERRERGGCETRCTGAYEHHLQGARTRRNRNNAGMATEKGGLRSVHLDIDLTSMCARTRVDPGSISGHPGSILGRNSPCRACATPRRPSAAPPRRGNAPRPRGGAGSRSAAAPQWFPVFRCIANLFMCVCGYLLLYVCVCLFVCLSACSFI